MPKLTFLSNGIVDATGVFSGDVFSILDINYQNELKFCEFLELKPFNFGLMSVLALLLASHSCRKRIPKTTPEKNHGAHPFLMEYQISVKYDGNWMKYVVREKIVLENLLLVSEFLASNL